MKEIVLITDFSNTEEKITILRKLVDNLKDDYEICLNSHFILPQDIINKVDYYLYDKSNILIFDNRYKGVRSFINNSFNLIYKDYSAPASHFPAIIRQIFTSLIYLKSLRYDVVHLIEYDSQILNLDIFSQNLEEILNFDAIIYKDEYRFISNFYSLNLNKFSECDFIFDEDKVIDLYKRNFLEDFRYCIERSMFQIIFDDKNLKIKKEKDLLSFIEFGKYEIGEEDEYRKNDVLYFTHDNLYYFFAYNRSNNISNYEIIIDNIHILNFSLDPSFWKVDVLKDISEINRSKCYINNNLFFDIDFNQEENKDLIKFQNIK